MSSPNRAGSGERVAAGLPRLGLHGRRPLKQGGMSVFRRALPYQHAGRQPGIPVQFLGEAFGQLHVHGNRRIGLPARQLPDFGPELALHPVRRQFEPHQCTGRRVGTGDLHGDRIGGVFLASRQDLAVSIEVRGIPAEKHPQQLSAPDAAAGHAFQQAMPTQAKPIDPSAEISMAAMEMAEFMGDYCPQFASVQRLQQRQAQDQIVALAPQAQPAWNERSRGIEFAVDDDTVQRRGAHRFADALDLGTKLRRFVRLQLVAFGQHEADPQRAQHDRTGHAQDDDRESHVRVDRRPYQQQVQEHEGQRAERARSVAANTA